jgi:peptidoglycan/LPS O-acetylase OafA/YrhL
MNLAIAVLLIASLLGWMGLSPVVTPPALGLERLALALGYATALWALTLAVVGFATQRLSGHSAARRYVADSSYWIYLIHLPLVMVLQAAVSRLDWPWEAKFAIVLGVGFPVMFASYQLLVRRTVIGAILNGRRVPKPARALPLQPEAAR